VPGRYRSDQWAIVRVVVRIRRWWLSDASWILNLGMALPATIA
jgi:hypothetical protein